MAPQSKAPATPSIFLGVRSRRWVSREKGAAPALPRSSLEESPMPRGRKKQALGPGTKPKCPLRDRYSRAKQGTGSCARKKGARIFSAAAAAPGPSRGKAPRTQKVLLSSPPLLSPPPLQAEAEPESSAEQRPSLQRGQQPRGSADALPFSPPRLRHLSEARAKRCSLSPPLQLSPLGFPCWLSSSSSSRLLGTDTRPAWEQPAEPSRAVLSGRSRKRPVTFASPPPTSPSAKPLFSPPKRRLPNSNPRWTHCNMFRPLPALLLAPGHSTACPRASRLDGRPFPCLDIQRSIEVGRPSIRSERSRLPFPPKV